MIDRQTERPYTPAHLFSSKERIEDPRRVLDATATVFNFHKNVVCVASTRSKREQLVLGIDTFHRIDYASFSYSAIGSRLG
jgi:hypothetical protein